MELIPTIELLRQKRSLFHSEADFQFALAWEIQVSYPTAEIRLEYPLVGELNKHIDILVRADGFTFPIEIKYKTEKLSVFIESEQYNLKNHGAQDLGSYDFIKDICRVESFATHLEGFKCGYVLWLTNDKYYWNAPIKPDAGYVAFSVHHGAKKAGTMRWGSHLGVGTIRGRENELQLRSEYNIIWGDYSNLGIKGGAFKYVLLQVEKLFVAPPQITRKMEF